MGIKPMSRVKIFLTGGVGGGGARNAKIQGTDKIKTNAHELREYEGSQIKIDLFAFW